MQCTLVSYQKTCFGCQIWIYWKLTFEGLHIVIIQNSNSKKYISMCIMAQTLVTHHLNYLIWKLCNISQNNKISINKYTLRMIIYGLFNDKYTPKFMAWLKCLKSKRFQIYFYLLKAIASWCTLPCFHPTSKK